MMSKFIEYVKPCVKEKYVLTDLYWTKYKKRLDNRLGKATEKNSIRDARTPQPGEIFFNTMGYRSSVTVQSSRYFQSSVSYIKVQIMLKYRKLYLRKRNVCKDEVLKQDN